MNSQNTQNSYEEVLNKLEKVIKDLENESLDLDESIKLYEEGATLYLKAKNMLSSREEKALEIINVLEETNAQLTIDEMKEE